MDGGGHLFDQVERFGQSDGDGSGRDGSEEAHLRLCGGRGVSVADAEWLSEHGIQKRTVQIHGRTMNERIENKFCSFIKALYLNSEL